MGYSIKIYTEQKTVITLQILCGGNYTIPTGGTEVLQQTGFHKVNNIYDMGGNVSEITTENYTESSDITTIRGGYYNNSANTYPASIRQNIQNTVKTSYIGFRVMLYL